MLTGKEKGVEDKVHKKEGQMLPWEECQAKIIKNLLGKYSFKKSCIIKTKCVGAPSCWKNIFFLLMKHCTQSRKHVDSMWNYVLPVTLIN